MSCATKSSVKTNFVPTIIIEIFWMKNKSKIGFDHFYHFLWLHSFTSFTRFTFGMYVCVIVWANNNIIAFTSSGIYCSLPIFWITSQSLNFAFLYLYSTGWRVDSHFRRYFSTKESFLTWISHVSSLKLLFIISAFDVWPFWTHEMCTYNSKRKSPSHFKCEILGLSHQNNMLLVAIITMLFLGL